MSQFWLKQKKNGFDLQSKSFGSCVFQTSNTHNNSNNNVSRSNNNNKTTITEAILRHGWVLIPISLLRAKTPTTKELERPSLVSPSLLISLPLSLSLSLSFFLPPSLSHALSPSPNSGFLSLFFHKTTAAPSIWCFLLHSLGFEKFRSTRKVFFQNLDEKNKKRVCCQNKLFRKSWKRRRRWTTSIRRRRSSIGVSGISSHLIRLKFSSHRWSSKLDLVASSSQKIGCFESLVLEKQLQYLCLLC